MLRTTCASSSIPALIAAFFLVVPSAALPCLGSERAQLRLSDDKDVGSCCCCKPADDTTGASKPERPQHLPVDGIPCDCPPSCPAPCGCGKLPCPPVESVKPTVDMTPIGVLAIPASLLMPDAAPSGIFHPPRD